MPYQTDEQRRESVWNHLNKRGIAWDVDIDDDIVSDELLTSRGIFSPREIADRVEQRVKAQ